MEFSSQKLNEIKTDNTANIPENSCEKSKENLEKKFKNKK